MIGHYIRELKKLEIAAIKDGLPRAAVDSITRAIIELNDARKREK